MLRKNAVEVSKDREHSMISKWIMMALLSTAGLLSHISEASFNTPKSALPSIEEYATIESIVDGAPVYSFSNICYVYGVSPDLLPGVEMQKGNSNPKVKIKPKKSWEIKHNLVGSEHEMTVRSPWTDSQPFLPIHLIDGDPDTVWSSWGSTRPDVRPEWVRIDLPAETEVASVALVCSRNFPTRNSIFGQVLPKEIDIKISRDAWHWETVFESKDFQGDDSGITVIEFEPRLAKQIWITGNNFANKDRFSGYIFSIGEVEVRDKAENNLALLSRGSGVTVSSTSYGILNDRFTQDALWGPLQYDMGAKWVRLGADNGSFTWNYVELEKGKLKIDPRADESITECVRNGVNVIMVLDWKGNWRYENPPRKLNWRQARFREINDNYSDPTWWVFSSPEMLEGYLKYVDYMVRHFKGRVAYFEIGNEWTPLGVGRYMNNFFEPTYKAIKKADPNARIKLGSTPGFLTDDILDCLGQKWEYGIRDGRLFAQNGNTIVIAENMSAKDVVVSVDAVNDGQCGIVLRYKDADNYLAAFYNAQVNCVFFSERIGGNWGPNLAQKNIQKALGKDIHLVARAEGPNVTLTVSDGTKQITTNHVTRHFNEAGKVGMVKYPAGNQMFDNLNVTNLKGKTIFKEDFTGPDGTVPPGLRYVSGAENPIKPDVGARIDALGWHPTCPPDKAYFEAVREFKKKCEALGFKGRYFADEIYAGSIYPPPEHWPFSAMLTEIGMAKYLAISMTGHNGLDMEAGPCHPHFSGFAHAQSLSRPRFPTQTIHPCQPTPSYYVLRTISTVMDDFYPAEFPVLFTGNKDVLSFTFKSGDKKELLLAAWIQGSYGDKTEKAKTDVTFPEIIAGQAWVVDIFNGTKQELSISFEGNDTLLKGMLIKDYPTFIRLRTK